MEVEGGTSREWSLRCSKPFICALHSPVSAALYQVCINNELPCVYTGLCFIKRVHNVKKPRRFEAAIMALNAVEGLFWFLDILQARLFRSGELEEFW